MNAIQSRSLNNVARTIQDSVTDNYLSITQLNKEAAPTSSSKQVRVLPAARQQVTSRNLLPPIVMKAELAGAGIMDQLLPVNAS